MAYTAMDKILAEHYNTFVAGAGTFGVIDNDVANINTIYGAGFNDKGYGQTSFPLTQVPVGTVVSATQWAALIANIVTVADHQTTSLGSMPDGVTLTASNALVIGIEYEIVTAGTGNWTTCGAADSNPGTQFEATATTNGAGDGTAFEPILVGGDLIKAITTMQSNIDDIFANRLNAIATGVTQVDTATTGVPGNWSATSVHTINVQFTSAQAARYFFNAGGNIAISADMAQDGTLAKTDVWDDGAGNGILPESGSIHLNAQGTTKVGGTGVDDTDYFIEEAIGYYGIGIAPIETFKQFTLGGGSYPTNHLVVEVQTNGVQAGGDGNNGDLITFTVTLFDDVGAGDPVDGTTTVTATVNFPGTTYLDDAPWSTVTFVPASSVVET